MLRFLILCLGMLTTRAGKLETAPVGAARGYHREEPRVSREMRDPDDTWRYAPEPPQPRAAEGAAWGQQDLVLGSRRVRLRLAGPSEGLSSFQDA